MHASPLPKFFHASNDNQSCRGRKLSRATILGLSERPRQILSPILGSPTRDHASLGIYRLRATVALSSLRSKVEAVACVSSDGMASAHDGDRLGEPSLPRSRCTSFGPMIDGRAASL